MSWPPRGWLRANGGRGTRVTFDPAARPVTASVEGLYRNLVEMGRETQVALVSFDYVSASADVARALGCDIGNRVQMARRVRSVDGAPFSHLTTWVPESVGLTYSADELAAMPMLTLLERAGVEVSGAAQTMSACLADGEVAARLDVDAGSPLLRVTRTVRGQNGARGRTSGRALSAGPLRVSHGPAPRAGRAGRRLGRGIGDRPWR